MASIRGILWALERFEKGSTQELEVLKKQQLPDEMWELALNQYALVYERFHKSNISAAVLKNDGPAIEAAYQAEKKFAAQVITDVYNFLYSADVAAIKCKSHV